MEEYILYENQCISIDYSKINYYYYDINTKSFERCNDNCFSCTQYEKCYNCDSYYCLKDGVCYDAETVFEGFL